MENSLTNERLTGIGGTDAAVCLGVHPYKTPYQLYLEKIGEGEEFEGNAFTFWGTVMEPVLVTKFRGDHLDCDVKVDEPMLRSPKYPWMIAHVDGLIDYDNGDKGILEIKTASSFVADKWGEEGTDQIPREYICQVMHYMIVTGRKFAKVVVLIGGNDYREYHVDYDKELADRIIKATSDFWTRVELKAPPACETEEDVSARYPVSHSGLAVEANSESVQAVKKLKELKEKKKEIDEAIKGLEVALKNSIGKNEHLMMGDTKLATWTNVSSMRFDSKRFQKEEPELFRRYQSQSSYRRFTLTRKDINE